MERKGKTHPGGKGQKWRVEGQIPRPLQEEEEPVEKYKSYTPLITTTRHSLSNIHDDPDQPQVVRKVAI